MKCKMVLGSLLSLTLASIASALTVQNGLVMHLDADALNLADGAAVVNWNDKSTSNNDAVQATAAAQPVYVAGSDAYNGHACVQFDGVDDWLDVADAVAANSFTVFLVGKLDANGSDQYFLSGQTDADANRFRIAEYGWSAQWRFRAGASDYAASSKDTAPHIFTMNNVSNAWVDGTAVTGGANSSDLTPDIRVGSYKGTSGFLGGSVAEVILYDRTLSDAEVIEVGYYLAAKYSSIETDYLVGAHNRVPAADEINVVPGESITWDAGLDPADQTAVNPAILKHYVYMSNGSPVDGVDDPNLYLVDTIDITNYSDPIADGVYTPSLQNDMNYWWMVEEGIDDGTGNAYPAGNVNNIASATYKFTTIASFPVISALDSKLVAPGETVDLEISIASASEITDLKWYKDGFLLDVENDSDLEIINSTTSSILRVSNADANDEGLYHLIATNSAGDSDSAAETVELKLEKLLAWYKFEQNLDDSAGTNNAVNINGVSFVEGGPIADQSYVVDPNNANYGELTVDAYPNAGFGNGMDHFTYSAWVKMDEGQGGYIFGNFNEGTSTAVQFGANVEGHSVYSLVRQEGGAGAFVTGDGLTVSDGQWHFIAGTYDGSVARVFLDGLSVSEASVELINFAAWQNPMILLARNNRGNVDTHFDGQVDDLQIFNYAKTQEDIAREYFNVSGNQVCLYGNPTYDLTGPDDTPDCSVDILDFAAFAADWMSSGLYPLN